MKKIEDYRQHGKECRQLAGRSQSTEQRTMLMNMAETWESLALDRTAHIARQQRLANLEAGAQLSIPVDKLNASNDD